MSPPASIVKTSFLESSDDCLLLLMSYFQKLILFMFFIKGRVVWANTSPLSTALSIVGSFQHGTKFCVIYILLLWIWVFLVSYVYVKPFATQDMLPERERDRNTGYVTSERKCTAEQWAKKNAKNFLET